MDALSEFLRAVKISGALFYDAHCTAPWCVRSPPSRAFREYVATPTAHVIEFHLVASGRCYVRVAGETTELVAGDAIVLPHGQEHHMGNGAAERVIDGEPALAQLRARRIEREHLGGGGEATQLVCGYLACESRLIERLLTGLPNVVRVPMRSDPIGASLETTIRHTVLEAAGGSPGSDAILARLAEVLFVEALRRYVVQQPPGRTGWLAGAADPAVSRALAALHAAPAYDWTLERLARDASVSRSVLTERFARHLGQSPMAYLADWRLELAAGALRSSERGVVQIAADVGYESEAAFSRAFKRRFGVPPARYRRAVRGELLAADAAAAAS